MKKQDQKELIKARLGRGREAALSRDTLSAFLGVPAKKVDRLIKGMRYEDAEPICAEKDDGIPWYFYPRSADEALMLLNSLMPKLTMMLRLVHKLQRFITTQTDARVVFKNLPDLDKDLLDEGAGS